MAISRIKPANKSTAKAAKQPVRRQANPVGRPVGRNSSETRETILTVAEALFAEGGYDGTSIRDIGQRAHVQAAVIGYHFGTKAELFDAVVERRGALLNATRLGLLEAAKKKSAESTDSAGSLDTELRFTVSGNDQPWRCGLAQFRRADGALGEFSAWHGSYRQTL